MIRLAAIGDLHCQRGHKGAFKPAFDEVHKHADIFLLAGDLTRHGEMEEIQVLANELDGVDVPMFAVLGNHDYHYGNEHKMQALLEKVGVRVLDGDTVEIDVNGKRVGFVGTKGFGGGFGIRALSDFGEWIFREMYREAMSEAVKIRQGLSKLQADYRVVLLHYAPIKETLEGEPLEVYPFLGSSALAEPIDSLGADLVLHGHAHYGIQAGETPTGITVLNVSLPALGRPYVVYELS